MATASMSSFLRRLTRGMASETLRDLSDRQLVERLLAGPDETVFETIVRRHGPMVYHVCWRVLQQEQDAEDAFQATFLILAQQLRTVRRHASLASWLHGVAHRVALKAGARAATRRRHEQKAARELLPPDEVTWRELRAILDSELEQLPEKWRLPLVLCYLEGQTQDEAARQLGASPRTLRRRLEEAKTALGRRLTGRGAWPAALSAVLLSDCVAPAAPAPRLIGSTVEAAARVATGQAAGIAGIAGVSTRVAALTEGVLEPMFTSTLKIATAAFVLLAALAVGIGGLLFQTQAAEPPQPPKTEKPATKDAERPQAKPVIVKDGAQLTHVVWDADGKTVATVGFTVEVVKLKDDTKVGLGSHTIKLWDATTGKLARSLGEEKDTLLQSLAVSRDRKTVALAIGKLNFDREKGAARERPEMEVRIMDARTWELKHKFTYGSDNDNVEMTVSALALSPDGKRLALVGSPRLSSVVAPVPLPGDEPPGCLKLWDVEKQHVIDRKPKKDEPALKIMRCLAFSPDGKVIAAGEKDGKIRLFDGQTGEPRTVLEDHKEAVYRLDFSPDGKTLASASQDHTVKLWNVVEGKLRQTLQRNRLWAVAFSPDGKLLATAGGFEQEKDKWQFEVILWDAKTLEQKQTVSTNLTVPAVSLAFSPDGKTLAVAGGFLGDVKDGAKTSGEIGLIPLE
jgi:RNA polymerase sigma factor (sigma-70 family)